VLLKIEGKCAGFRAICAHISAVAHFRGLVLAC
jgi:hypothetical protein